MERAMDKCRWHCLSNKESVVIIVCYAIYALCYGTSFYSMLTTNKAVLLIVFIPTIIMYCLLGLIGEVFVGRQRLINFSIWVQWIAMIISSLIAALKFAYDFPQCMVGNFPYSSPINHPINWAISISSHGCSIWN